MFVYWENVFENILCKIAAILWRSQCVKEQKSSLLGPSGREDGKDPPGARLTKT